MAKRGDMRIFNDNSLIHTHIFFIYTKGRIFMYPTGTLGLGTTVPVVIKTLDGDLLAGAYLFG